MSSKVKFVYHPYKNMFKEQESFAPVNKMNNGEILRPQRLNMSTCNTFLLGIYLVNQPSEFCFC